MNSGIVLSQADKRPMYLQIMEQVQGKVASGDWQPGDEIPSIRGLAVELSISVITVKRAYQELERAGVIVTQQGKGSRVSQEAKLGKQLQSEELDRHLRELVRVARVLGIGVKELESRLRKKMKEAGSKR